MRGAYSWKTNRCSRTKPNPVKVTKFGLKKGVLDARIVGHFLFPPTKHGACTHSQTHVLCARDRRRQRGRVCIRERKQSREREEQERVREKKAER